MKRNRRIIKLVTAFLLTAVIVCASILVIRFNKFEKGGSQTPEKIYNYVDVSQSDINFQLAGNGKSYIVKGFTGSSLPALSGSNDKYRLTIPETYDNGTTGPLAVSAIDIGTVGSNPDMTSKWFPTANNPGDQRVKAENIVSVVVPESVQTISVGAFNSFINVEEMVLPFIGTQRGNNASEDGYLSSMYALFGDSKFMGQVDANFDVQTNGNKTKIEEIIDPNTGAILADGNGKITWYDTTGTTIDYDTSSDIGVITGTLQRRTAVVVPAHLKSVTITDEYLVANHAFFMMLPLKKVSIDFSKDIPVTIEGANSIGERVFDTASNLVEAYLPDAISTLREGVFSFCSRLKTVLPQSKVAAFQNGTLVANSASMSKLLDSGDGQGLVYLPLDGNTNATIPDATFYGCRSIQNMVLSSEIRSIGRYAFGGDSGLRKVLTSLQLATYDFTSEKNTNILPANVTLVNDYAFRNCSGLKNMTIETSLKTMGAGVFNACSSLESLTIPFIGKERGNGTSIVANAYTDGTQESLFGYIFGELGSENPSYKKVFQATTANPAEERVYAEMQINGGTGSGGASAGVNVSQVNVPFAYFYIPTSLQSVTITNESVISIGAFMNCSMIENLQIYSFSENESGLSTTQIGQGALAGCSGLTTLSIPFVGRTDVGMDRNTLFDGRGGKGRQLGHAFGIYSGFSGCPAVTQQEPFTTAAEYYYIPESLKSVELNHQSYVPSYAFWNCSGLETVIIGDKTKGMQRSMFKGCTNLTNLTVPFVGVQRGLSNDNVKWYFWGYDHEIRNSCIWFFSSAYTNGEYYNAYVTDWRDWHCYIPYSLKNITVTQEYYYETNAFKGFHQVENITIRAIDDYTSMHIDSGIMNGCSNIEQIDIPFIGRDYNRNSESNQAYTIGWLFGTAGYSNAYAATQATGGSTTTFQIPKSLDTILIDKYFTRIADGAFRNMSSLVSVTNSGERAANISYLGSYAFANCYNLQTVDFPRASYTDMGNYAFSNCVSLAKIDEFSPLTVTKIGHHALEGTSVSVVDFSRYSYIGDYAFANCLQLTQVDMAGPDTSLILTPASSYTTAIPNYTYVGNHMFANCVNLTDVTLKPLKTVGSVTYTYATPYMFQNCTSLEDIVIDNCMNTIPDGLFDGCSKLKDNSQPGQGLVMTASTSPITRIGENAFRGCSTMQTLALPERLQSIGRGAFQRCSNLDSLRIPRECDLIPYGSDFNQTPVFDDYVSGVFYGCNEDKFYLEVYHPEEDWNTVLQWGQNWNCYFPVYIIGDQSENLFTYEYCPTLKGYLITGLNYEEVDFAPNGNLLLKGTLKFPNTHDGLIVYGLTDNCFKAEEFYVRALINGDDYNGIGLPKVHPFYAVDTFVLGQNFVSMGQGSLNFNNLNTTDDTTVYRTVFSQKTVAQAKAATGVICSCLPGTIHSNELSGLSYDDEIDYIPNGIVYYKDIWQYGTKVVNGNTVTTTTPVFKINALIFSLDSSSFQYQLGAEVKPKITSVEINETYVKYAGDKESYREQGSENDQLYYMLYNDNDELDLGSFYIKYSNNVNVGRGKIEIRSNNSRIVGTTELGFDITKRRIDVLYQSGEHPDLYGGFTPQNGYTALTHFKSLLRSNQHENLFYNPNSAVLDNLTIVTMEYTGKPWSVSNWSTSGNVFGIPKDYVFSGTLSTASADAGYYMAYNNASNGTQLLPKDRAEMVDYTNVFADRYYQSNYSHLSGAAGIASGKVGTINGFQWTTQPRITYRGTDVTSNFEIVVNYAVFIAKRVVSNTDEIDWGGYYNDATGNYEFEYNGSPIVPVPSVIDRVTGSKIPASIEVGVTPDEVIYPTTTPHRSTIVKYDTKNFFIELGTPLNRYNFINFIVVPAKLKIVYECTQFTIGEFGDNFTYDFSQKKAINGKVTGRETLEITKLAPTDYIVGEFHSVNADGPDWEEGTYSSVNPKDGKKLVLNIKVYSKTKNPDGSPIDVTSYYDLENALKASVKIVYNDFDYDFTISYDNLQNTVGLTTLNGVYTHHIPANSKDYKNVALGVENYNESQNNINIVFGLDGYSHEFSVKIKNATDTDPTSLARFDDGDTSNASFTVTDFSKMQYVYTLHIEKERYYSVTKTVTVTPQKGHYYFGDISKEYDRKEINPLSKILRLPKDFVSSNMSFKYYEATDWFYSNEINPPVEVGEYKFTATTTTNHSEFFVDLTEFPRTEQDISQCNFRITRRSIYIDVVDDIAPYDNKDYDGLPWEKRYVDATNVTHTVLNLLDGDVFNGFFMSRSAEIGVYDGDVNGDFILASAQPWSVMNTSLDKQNQTSNYRIVFRGKYEILPLKIEYECEKVQSYIYDGLYHALDITVNKPTYGATIYYSDRILPVDDADWAIFPTQFASPNTYTIYFKITAPHYETVMDNAVLIIEGRQVQFGVTGQHHSYDGYSHGITVTPVDPITAKVGYCLLEGTNNNLLPEDYEKLSYSETCPQVIAIGTYQYAIRVTHSNYTPAYQIVTMYIENDGTPHNAIAQDYDGIFDGDYHGPIINLTNVVSAAGPDGENLLISYHVGGKEITNPTWTTIGLSTDALGNRFLHIFKEAMQQATKVTVRIMLPGYQLYEQEVTVFIRTRSLSLDLQNYNDVFDNKYHTVVLKLSPSAAATATLVVYDHLNDAAGTIVYRYYFGVDDPSTTENELDDIPFEELTVRYHNNVSMVPYSSIEILKYKNVCSEQVAVYVTAPNCQPQTLAGTVVIRFNENPQVEFTEDDFEIQYLARPVTLKDMEKYFATNHDGTPDPVYYKASDLTKTIKAPQELGYYKIVVSYPRTMNCAAKSAEAYFRIVPRKIDIELENDELEYNGRPQTPVWTIDTHTDEDKRVDLLDFVVEGQAIEIGDYTLRIGWLNYDANYTLGTSDEILNLPFKIIPRKLHVVIDETVDRTVPPTKWQKNDDWTPYITGLLSNDSLSLDIETKYGYVSVYRNYDTYRYKADTNDYTDIIPKTDIPDYESDVLVNSLVIIHTDDNGNQSIAPYYDVVFDVKVNIAFPQLKVEVNDKEVHYDGKEHGLDITVLTPGVQSTVTEYYFTSDPSKTPFYTFLETEAGVYEVHYSVSTSDGEYTAAEGVATLTIKKTSLNFAVDPLEVLYDGTGHQVTFTFLEDFELPVGYEPRYYYFNKEELDQKKITPQHIIKFFDDGMPATSARIYDIYMRASTREKIVDAGEYIAVVYFPETSNWFGKYGLGDAKINRRPIYFDWLDPSKPMTYVHTYDGEMPPAQSLGGSRFNVEQNKAATEANTGGLVRGHSMSYDPFSLAQTTVWPIECNARGGKDAYPGYEDPYQFDGDFQFCEAVIMDGEKNVYKNYYPVVNPIEDTDNPGQLRYLYQIIILRAKLHAFDVDNLVKQYDDLQTLPQIVTPSDGARTAYYYKVADAFDPRDPGVASNYLFSQQLFYENDPNDLQEDHSLTRDVSTFLDPTVSTDLIEGWYLVYVTIEECRNFFAWDGGATGQDYDTDPLNGLAQLPAAQFGNRKYKSAYVQITPREVEVQWKMLETEFDVDIDGVAVQRSIMTDIKPYFVNEKGGNSTLRGWIYDPNDLDTPLLSVAAAGGYSVSATLQGTNLNPLNYILNHANNIFRILPKEYTIHESISEPYLKTYWHKDYTEADFLEAGWIHEDVSLELEVRTKLNQAGFFYRQSDFVITQKMLDANGDDYSDSVHFNLDYKLYLKSSEIMVNAPDVVALYDGTIHEPVIEITNLANGYYIRYDVVMINEQGDLLTTDGIADLNDYSINYHYSYPGDNYSNLKYECMDLSETNATLRRVKEFAVFKDVGIYRVFYQVTSSGLTDDASVIQKTGYLDVIIEQAQSQLYFANTGLDRVYNGLAPSESQIRKNLASGHFNGTEGDLIIKYYIEGTTTELTSAPITVGRYTIHVTSSADSNPNVIKNYTVLDTSYDFEITRRPVTLVANAHWQVTDAELNNTSLLWTSKNTNTSTSNKEVNGGNTSGSFNFTILNSFNQSTSDYYIPNPGLVVSDYFVFQINSLDHLERGTYQYKSSTAQGNNFSFDAVRTMKGLSQGSYGFDCEWDFFYDDQNGDPSDDANKSENYLVYIDFTLVVHYKYMNIILTNKEYDYDQTQTRSPYDNIQYQDPAEGAFNMKTYYRLENEGDAAYTENIGDPKFNPSAPGVYSYYIKVTADEYEDYEKKTTVTIKYRQRDKDYITIDPQFDLGKTYDNIPYDSSVLLPSSGLLVNYQWDEPNIVGGEILPSSTTWKIEYFVENPDTGLAAGDALTEVVDAGNYWYRLTIPAGNVYGPTVIEKKFSISPRQFKISGPATLPTASDGKKWVEVGYTGNLWTYDIAKNLDQFIVEMDSGGKSGLLLGHYISVGVINSSYANVGKYVTSGVDLYIDTSLGTNFRILDGDGENVRGNYQYVIDFGVEITKGTIDYEVHCQNQYIYLGSGPNDYYAPYVQVLRPADGNQYVEYYNYDLMEWTSEIPRYQDVGNYTLTFRALNVPNYNNLEQQDVTFEIVKRVNVLTIEDLTREFNNSAIDYPTITTLNLSAQKVSPSDPFIQSIAWQKWDEGTNSWIPLNQRPIDVGKYKVLISINSTSSYDGVANEREFEITPRIVVMSWDRTEFEYAAIPQAPKFTLTAKNSTTMSIMSYLGSAAAANAFSVLYYDLENLAAGPSTVKPTDVGRYRVEFTFINNGALNFSFSDAASVVTETKNFQINKRNVTIKLSGSVDTASAGSDSTIRFTNAVADNLPDLITFDGILVRKNTTVRPDNIVGKLADTEFADWYEFNNNQSKPTFYFKSTTPGVQFGPADNLERNYELFVEIHQNVTYGSFAYTVKGYNGPYDGGKHYIDFTPLTPDGDITKIEYSVNGGSSWTTELPAWTDASNITHWTVVRVQSQLYGTVVCGEDKSDTGFAVTITPLKTSLNTDDVNLSKVYDGKPISNPQIHYNTVKENEDRSAYLRYDYYQLNELTDNYDIYVGNDNANIVNAHKYKLIVHMESSANYEGSNPDEPLNSAEGYQEIFFEIYQRPISIEYKGGQKEYDNTKWLYTIRNTEVRPIINNPDSGLIDGHLFNGTIQTKDVIADEYIGESGFEWQNGYSIYSGPNDVTNNYRLIYNIDAKISKRKLNVTVSPITVPFDNSPHYLIINWGDKDSIILPYNLTDVEQAIQYADNNNGDEYLSDFSNVRSSRTAQGTTKVNIKIELPNYEVFQTSAYITILPNKSGLKLTYWPGKLEHLVYNGHQYPEEEITYTLDVEPGRLVTFKYYEVMEDGTERELTDRPIEVGKYYVIGHVAAGVEGDEEYSAKYPFEIIQRPKRIEWQGDTHSTDEDGNIVDAMIFRGADVEIKPDAFFNDVFDNTVPMKVKFVDAQGQDKTYDSFSIGYYYVKAELDPDHQNYEQYVKNYKFSNDLIVFKIIGAIAGGETGGGDGGDDDPDPNYTGLKFKDPQGDGRSQEDEAYEAQALLDDGKLYITAFKYYTDKPTETIVYTVDLDSGDVLEINGEAVTSDTDMSFHFVIPKNEAGKPDIKTLVNEEATFEIKAQLKDKINTAWSNEVDEDGKADVADKPIKIKIKPTKLDPTHTTHDPYPEPDGTDVPDIILDPYPTTFLWEGEAITFPLTIHVTHGTVDTSDDDYLVEGLDYKVDWFKNDGPTGATSDSLASFIVTSIEGRIYEFAFGDINYPDDNTKHGGTFTILSTTGDRIEIKETAPHYRFAYYQIDMAENFLSVKVLDVKRQTPLETDVTRDDLLDAEEAESTAQEELRKSIYLINVYQGHRVADLLENLANLPEDIVITANVYDDTIGSYVPTVVYDEKQDPAIQDMSVLITTGTRVSLYKHGADHTSGNEIDAVEIMIKGDISGDGEINVSDLTSAYEYISDPSQRDPASVYYLASLVQTEAISEEVPATPHINVATISALNNHIKGVLDANSRGDDNNPQDINLSCKKHSIYDVSGSNSEN